MTQNTAQFDSLMERKYVRDLARANAERAVVLIGSWARRTRTSPTSDVDLLVLDTTAPEASLSNVQVLTIAPDDFNRRASRGDELAQWALRFGVPLSGARLWRRLKRDLLSDSPWPSPKVQIERAAKRLRGAEALCDMGDYQAAAAEVRLALSHLARAELLGRGVFPLSRPELPRQLAAVGDEELADALGRSIDYQMPDEELRDSFSLLAGRLAQSKPSIAHAVTVAR